MPDNLPTKNLSIRILYGAALTAFLLPLLLYTVTGSTARFIQDDYCYAVHLRNNGWPNAAMQAYLTDSGFSGNRFALTFFLDLAEITGRFNVPALPGLMIALWLPAVYWLARELNRILSGSMSRWTSLLLSTALVSLTLYLAPNRVQVLYWRPGMFTYLAPMILFFGLAAWMASRVGREINAWTLAGLAALALVVGSFSETAAVFEAGVFALAILAAWIGLRRGHPLARGGFRLAWAGLFGSLLAMAGLILSPAAHLRQAAMFPDPPPPLEIMQITVESARFFVVHTLYRVSLPTLAIGGLAFCLGYLAGTRHPKPGQHPLRRLFWQLFIIVAGAFFLLLCVTAPSAYAEATYPEARVLVFARMIVVVFTGAVGWWCGEALAGMFSATQRNFLFSGLVAFLAAVYTGGMLLIQPGTLVEPAYPDLRAYVYAHPLAVIAVVAASVLVVILVTHMTQKRQSPHLATVLLAAVFLIQPIYATRTALLEFPDYQLRGQMWDLRDAQIREMRAEGQRILTVRALDSWAQITELQENLDHWVNHCASDFYGVDSIKAVEPILNPPRQLSP